MKNIPEIITGKALSKEFQSFCKDFGMISVSVQGCNVALFLDKEQFINSYIGSCVIEYSYRNNIHIQIKKITPAIEPKRI